MPRLAPSRWCQSCRAWHFTHPRPIALRPGVRFGPFVVARSRVAGKVELRDTRGRRGIPGAIPQWHEPDSPWLAHLLRSYGPARVPEASR